MRRMSLMTLLLCLCCAWGGMVEGAATVKGTRWALLVGVEEYENPEVSRLRYAVRDVTRVAETL